MRNNKYLYDLFTQILLILFVTYLFKTSPKIQASFWASALFLLMPISMMMREWMFYRTKNKIWWASVLQFWLLFAIPIFTLRIIYPHTSLSEVTVGPIQVEVWHKISSYSYLLLMGATLWSWWKNRQEAQKKKP